MKKIEINLQTQNINDKVELFKTYLKLLNVKKQLLTNNMIDVLSLLMLHKTVQQIGQELNMKLPNVYAIIKELQKKGFLKDDKQLHDKLKSFSDFVNSNPELELSLTFKFNSQ